MLIQNSRGEFINIDVQVTDTFNSIKERMLAEYGVQMDFANLCKGKEIDLNDNILHSLKRNNQKLAVDTDHRLRSQFLLNQFSIERPWTTVIFGTIILEPEAVQPEEIYIDEDESMISDPASSQDPMETTSGGQFSDHREQSLQRCRLCGIENHEMTPIFDSAADHALAGKIRDCFSIIVHGTDTCKQICQSCMQNLHKYHEFHENVLKANEKFGNSGVSQNNRRQRDTLERVCFSCCGRFPGMKELLSHLEGSESENDTIWECDMCTARPSFTTKCRLAQHQRIHKEITRECLSCGARFANLPAYNYHINGNENDQELHCHVCNKSLKTKCGFGLHELSHKRKSEHECLSCGGRFATSVELACHMQGLEHDPELQCLTCNASFRTKCALTTHKIIHPETCSCQNIFSCAECGKPFMEKTDLMAHVNNHLAENLFTCDICSNSFETKLDMEIHRKVHPKNRPYNCPECNKTFPNSARLREHKKLHTNEKPYKCNLCGKAFKRPNSRKMHMTLHTGEKALKCDICGGSFSRGGDMRKHKILMHNL